jgi:hypothetical protein
MKSNPPAGPALSPPDLPRFRAQRFFSVSAEKFFKGKTSSKRKEIPQKKSSSKEKEIPQGKSSSKEKKFFDKKKFS